MDAKTFSIKNNPTLVLTVGTVPEGKRMIVTQKGEPFYILHSDQTITEQMYQDFLNKEKENLQEIAEEWTFPVDNEKKAA